VQPSVKIRAGDIEPTDPEYTSSAMSQIIEQGQPITNQDQRNGQEEARWNMSKQHLANVPSHAHHSLPKRTVIQAIWPVPYPKGMAARRSATGLEVIHRMKTARFTGYR
jgi:hypothetical protein